MKKALVVRLGAIGDMVIITPLLRALGEDGHSVTLYCRKGADDIVRHNPFIKKVIFHDEKMTYDEFMAHVDKLGKEYDKFINLTGSIEGSLLASEGTPEFDWPKYLRHSQFNVNYYDRTMMVGGYPEKKGLHGELFFSPAEEKQAREFRKKHKGKFIILWALAGSSFHKAWPYAEQTAKAFLDKHPDAMTITVGDELSVLLEWTHKQAKSYSGIWPVRKSLIMTKYADLVIGPDTGILNAAGCFDTQKILLLTGITPENISKTWNNVNVVTARNAECYPCHRLIHTLEACPIMPGINSPVCAANIPAGQVYLMIEEVYRKWREKRNGNAISRDESNLCRRYNRALLG